MIQKSGRLQPAAKSLSKIFSARVSFNQEPFIDNHEYGTQCMSTTQEPTANSAQNWQEKIFNILKQGGVKQVAYVPDAGHAHVIRRVQADADMRDIVLTTE